MGPAKSVEGKHQKGGARAKGSPDAARHTDAKPDEEGDEKADGEGDCCEINMAVGKMKLNNLFSRQTGKASFYEQAKQGNAGVEGF